MFVAREAAVRAVRSDKGRQAAVRGERAGGAHVRRAGVGWEGLPREWGREASARWEEREGRVEQLYCCVHERAS